MRPVRADLERMERLAEVVDRARERRKVEDEVHRPLDVDRLRDVVVQEVEAAVANVLEILERRGLEVVDADHAVALLEEVVAQVRPEEAGTAGDDTRAHAGHGSGGSAGSLTIPVTRQGRPAAVGAVTSAHT